MTDLYLCQHAETRVRQRGLSDTDIDLIVKHGIEVERGFMVTEKAGRAYIDSLKGQIQQMERLIGKRVVCDGSTVITAYHTGRRKSRTLLKKISSRDRR